MAGDMVRYLATILAGAFMVTGSAASAQDLPAQNSALAAQDTERCRTASGRAEMARDISPKQAAAEAEQLRIFDEYRAQVMDSNYRANMRLLGRAFADPAPVNLGRWHLSEVRNYCEVEGATRAVYTAPQAAIDQWDALEATAGELLEKQFVFSAQGNRRCQGDQNRCDGEIAVELPAGFQVCEVSAQPNPRASWRTGRVSYTLLPGSTNPADGAAPRARGAKVRFAGFTTNNYPAILIFDFKIRAIAIEFKGDQRFEKSCRMFRENEALFTSDSPRPGREMHNVNN